MTTILNFTWSQPDIPLRPFPSFIEQARTCSRLASALGESSDTAWNQALSSQLHACLAQLQPGLLEPIPTNLIDSFTVDMLPTESPYFDADCTELCRYCMALSKVLTEHRTDAETADILCDLLCGLTGYFVEDMMAPRWVRGAEAVNEIRYA
ncbi:MAG TPA: hypothetical protein VJS14_01670 [Enterobacteriaceae bacterium]|nr:hypothetical protein [Enterobacteriaceae bacterium]